jgi:ADP-heptose:LPS heptosyltransferase
MRVLPLALARRFARMQRRRKPEAPRRILVAHNLLAGDTLMLTALVAKLRERYPDADIAMTVRPAVLPLYSQSPYGLRALAYDPRRGDTLRALLEEPGFDLALVPGDNRHSWLAAALGARWIVAFGGDRPRYKSWPVDETRRYRQTPAAWGDMAADLADGPAPRAYSPADWPAPACAAFDAPRGRYAVLHVETSNPLRHWEEAKWLELAVQLAARGLSPVWSSGPQGETLLRGIDPEGRFPALGHRLDLAQLWHLVADAALLVCPDTSVMHLGRLAGTPTVALFGPSSSILFGPGEFFRDMPGRSLTVADFHCRDQRVLFKREIEWVRRCARTPAECPAPRCMQAIGFDPVLEAALAVAKR